MEKNEVQIAQYKSVETQWGVLTVMFQNRAHIDDNEVKNGSVVLEIRLGQLPQQMGTTSSVKDLGKKMEDAQVDYRARHDHVPHTEVLKVSRSVGWHCRGVEP